MTTTLELPDELMRQIALRAAHVGQELPEAVAQLLRKGLAAESLESCLPDGADEAMLVRRLEMTRKFLSGEWGVELAGQEDDCEVDRRKELERAQAWRD